MQTKDGVPKNFMGIYDTIKQYRGGIRFHMPGHSGGILKVKSDFDITELSYSDNLLNPCGAIAETEKKLADFYGARYALLFTCGATSAVCAVMAALKQMYKKPKLFNCCAAHKSVYAQAEIHGVELTDTVNNADAVFNTSPDYFGKYDDNNADTYKNGRLCFLDASHAAHYPFIGRRIDGGLYDAIIYSLHKTLPVLTGAAAIVTDDLNLYEQLLLARSRTHSTSPSYLTMSSVDKFLDQSAGCNIGKTITVYVKIRREVDKFIEKCRFSAGFYDDYTRLYIKFDGYTAAEKAREYLESKRIYPETVIGDKIILIITPFNSKKLGVLLKRLNAYEPLHFIDPQIDVIKTDTVKSDGIVELISIDKAVGRVLYQDVGLYPPGVPIIYKGGVITEDAAAFIKDNMAKCFGLINGKIAVYVE